MDNQSKTRGATSLLASPPLKRLQINLHDLIIACLEAYSRTHGNCYALTVLHYVSDEKHEGRFSMHFDAQVKELEANVNIPLSLSFTVKVGDYECYQHS